MESRSTVLVVLFVVLLGAAGYYYWDEATNYAKEQEVLKNYPTVTNTVNYGLKLVGISPMKPSINATEVRTDAIKTYRGALVNTLPVDSIEWIELFRSKGITTQLDFSIDPQTDDQSTNQTVEGTLALEAFKNGGARGDLKFDGSPEQQYNQASLQVKSGAIYVSIPELDIRLKLPSFFTGEESPIDWGLSRFMGARVQGNKELSWQGTPVRQISLKSGDGSILRVFVTRGKPRTLVGVQVVADGKTYEREFVYGSTPPTIKAIKTFRSDELTNAVMFESGDDGLLVEIKNPQSDLFRRARLDFASSDPETPRARISIKPDGSEEYLSIGRVELTMSEGVPQGFRFTLDFTGTDGFPVGLSGQIESTSLSWLDESSAIDVTESGVTETTILGLVQKVARSNTLKLAQAEETTADDSDRQPGKQRDQETAQVKEKPSSETSKKQRRPERTTGSSDRNRREDRAREQPQPERNQRTQRSASPGDIPYPELVNAPSGSGETIKRSEFDDFPYTEPPESYRTAQKYYYDGDFKQAQKRLRELLEKYPQSVNVNYLLGVIHFELGNTEKSRKFFERALSLRHDPQLRAWSRHYLKILQGPDHKEQSGSAGPDEEIQEPAG